MFFIPGFLISAVTFPGVIVHELAHQFFCRLSRVAIFDTCYFRLGNPAGYVVHETPRNVWQHLLISVGPFLVNTVVGALIAFPAVLPLKFDAGDGLDFFLAWLGVSIAMHAFPSRGDAQSMFGALRQPDAPLGAKLVGFPAIGLIYLGAFGSFFWLDLIYGFVVAVALPLWFITWF